MKEQELECNIWEIGRYSTEIDGEYLRVYGLPKLDMICSSTIRDLMGVYAGGYASYNCDRLSMSFYTGLKDYSDYDHSCICDCKDCYNVPCDEKNDIIVGS